MSFIFTLNEAELFVRGANSHEEAISVFDIGYDDNNEVTYKCVVALSPIAGHGAEDRELYFIITQIDHNGEEIEHKDGLGTKPFLIDEHRVQVLNAIGNISLHMANVCDLKLLVINTVTTYLPDEALSKYEKLCSFFCANGYRGGKVDSYHGSEQWLLTKI